MKINYGMFRTLYLSSEINADHQLELLGKHEKKIMYACTYYSINIKHSIEKGYSPKGI